MKVNVFLGQWIDVIEFEPFIGENIEEYERKIEEFFYETIKDEDGDLVEVFKTGLPYTYLSGEAVTYWMNLVSTSANARVIEKEAIENVKKADYDDFDEGVKIEKKKIHTQIKSILVEKAKDYCIKNPTLTVLNLKELTGDTLIESISSIIMNLVERKEYDKALEMCKFFEQKTKDDEINKYIEKIRTVIVNMEIGNMIIKGINIGDDKDKRERYFDTISKGLNQKGISLDEIPLGEITKDGTKMTLADIYYVSDKYIDKEREV